MYLLIILLAFIISYISTPFARRLAIKLDAVDYPEARRINTKPTPRMGGVAIFIGLFTAIGLHYAGRFFLGLDDLLIPHPSMVINYWGLGLAATFMFAVGVADDVKGLSAKTKFVGQILAAIIAVSSGLLIAEISNPFAGQESLSLGIWAYPITIIYLVSFANIINLIDGLDGLASGIAIITGISMLIISIMFGRSDGALFSAALIGACLGFLRFNFHPASIFMGDSGSLLIGFMLGVISLLTVTRTAAVTSMIIPLIIAGVPIIDTFSAIVRRSRARVSIGHADKGHIHHRLLQSGLDQRRTVLIIWGWSALLAVGALAMTQVTVWWRIGVFILLLVISGIFMKKLHLTTPVLLHYYDPEKGDRIITPDDPCFKKEFEREKHDETRPMSIIWPHDKGHHPDKTKK